MVRVRPPAVAGVFYPADPTALLSEVRRLLGGVRVPPGPAPKALIVPHAALQYSGPIAASAYARLAGARGSIETVVLVGPAHYGRVAGIALSSATAFASPVGRLTTAGAATARVQALACARVRDGMHAPEHCLEVQLPFLRVVLGDVAILPLLAGGDGHAAAAVAEALETVWDGGSTVVIVTSDLSHYLGYAAARARDRSTAAAVEALDPDAIPEAGACGRASIQGLLRVARGRGLSAQAVDLRSSGDTGGGSERVVGYGAFVLQAAA